MKVVLLLSETAKAPKTEKGGKPKSAAKPSALKPPVGGPASGRTKGGRAPLVKPKPPAIPKPPHTPPLAKSQPAARSGRGIPADKAVVSAADTTLPHVRGEEQRPTAARSSSAEAPPRVEVSAGNVPRSVEVSAGDVPRSAGPKTGSTVHSQASTPAGPSQYGAALAPLSLIIEAGRHGQTSFDAPSESQREPPADGIESVVGAAPSSPSPNDLHANGLDSNQKIAAIIDASAANASKVPGTERLHVNESDDDVRLLPQIELADPTKPEEERNSRGIDRDRNDADEVTGLQCELPDSGDGGPGIQANLAGTNVQPDRNLTAAPTTALQDSSASLSSMPVSSKPQSPPSSVRNPAGKLLEQSATGVPSAPADSVQAKRTAGTRRQPVGRYLGDPVGTSSVAETGTEQDMENPSEEESEQHTHLSPEMMTPAQREALAALMQATSAPVELTAVRMVCLEIVVKNIHGLRARRFALFLCTVIHSSLTRRKHSNPSGKSERLVCEKRWRRRRSRHRKSCDGRRRKSLSSSRRRYRFDAQTSACLSLCFDCSACKPS